MARYRIHRIREAPRENFRWAAHTGGLAIVKPKDYDVTEEIEAATPYAVWKILTAGGRPLYPGDILETVLVEGSLEERAQRSRLDASPEELASSSPVWAREIRALCAPSELLITKYIGFEPAKWYVPEPRAEPVASAASSHAVSPNPELGPAD